MVSIASRLKINPQDKLYCVDTEFGVNIKKCLVCEFCFGIDDQRRIVLCNNPKANIGWPAPDGKRKRYGAAILDESDRGVLTKVRKASILIQYQHNSDDE